MRFIMNNLKWEIKEATAEEVKKTFNDNNENSYYCGSITHSSQIILINKETTIERQKETLYHELMHCYLYCYITNNIDNLDEETFCDISAKSHDIIHKIVEDYFNKK